MFSRVVLVGGGAVGLGVSASEILVLLVRFGI